MKKTIVLLMMLPAFVFSEVTDETTSPEERPLWEVGLFGGAAQLPHYRGSDEYSTYVLPLPYLIYRGEIIRANRDGVKGIFWSNDRIETSLSFTGSPPADKDNKAREGMPELGAILEVGPGLKVFLSQKDNPNPLYLKAGVRVAISVDTDDYDVAYQGIRGNIKLIYMNRTQLKDQGIIFGVNAGVDFANREYNDYIYSVDPVYATPTRPAYSADGGYTGFSLSANAVKKLNDRWSVGAYYRWDNISGTSYADSPLVKTENNHILGVAIICKLFKSEETSPFESE